MRLLQLQILVLIETEHSLVKVAEKLFISQPSISTALKEFEQELGCSLLERTNRGMKFTPIGQEVLQQAKIILDECENIREKCQETSTRVVQKILLGIEPDVTKELYAKLLVLAGKNKKIELEASFDQPNELILKLCDNKLDACMLSLAQKEYEPHLWELIAENSLQYTVFSQQEVCFITAESHPLQQKNSLRLDDILQYSVTLTGHQDKYFVDLFEDTAKNRYITYIYDPESYYAFLQDTDAVGICVCNEIEKNNVHYDKNLKPLVVDDFAFYYQTILLYKKEQLNEHVALLLKMLKKIV